VVEPLSPQITLVIKQLQAKGTKIGTYYGFLITQKEYSNMSFYPKIANKLSSGKTVYLYSSEGFAIEVKPSAKKHRVKRPDGSIYEIDSTTDLACETYLEANEITNDDFNSFNKELNNSFSVKFGYT
jgi:hypothetical protein